MSQTSRGGQHGEGSIDGFANWFYSQRAYPARSVPAGALANALASAIQNNGGLHGAPGDPPGPSLALASPTWVPLGPATIPDGQTDTTAGPALSPVSGRVSAIAVHPTNPNIVYVGGAQGGIWKSTNALSATPTWTPMSDHQPSMAIGDIAIDPVNPNIVYVGTGEPNGSCDSYYGRGILRSADGGLTWTIFGTGAGGPFDGQSVSKIVIDPVTAGSTATTTLWASTARAFLSSGTEQCIAAPEAWNGAVWRSTDSGATWVLQNVPTGVVAPNARIHDMALDPTNSNILYVGVRTNGIWKSVNAKGAPATFTKLAGGLPDLLATNPLTLRSTIGIGGAAVPGTLFLSLESSLGSALWGMYKSLDGGATWAHVDAGVNGTCNVTVASRTVTRVTGPAFTAAMIGQRIIVNNSFSRTVANVVDANTLTTSTAENTFSATLAGVSWSVGTYPTYCDGQCFYNMTLALDPTDATGNSVYIGGNPSFFSADTSGTFPVHTNWRSTDGGNTWAGISQGDGVSGGLHTDDHKIAFDSTGVVYDGNDGGIWRSNDHGASWTTMNTNVAITQFQSVGLHPSNPNIVLGGTQDNGTNVQNPALQPLPKWFHADFGDGGQSFIDQSTPSRMFHTYFNGSFAFMGPARSKTGGAGGPGSWDFVGSYYGAGGAYYNGINATDPVSFYAPIAAHPAFTPNVVYFASNKLYRAPDPQPPCCPTVAVPPFCGFPSVVCTTPPSWTVKSPPLTGQFLSAIGVFPALLAGEEVIYTGASDGRISVSMNVDGSAGLATWTTISGVAPLPPRFVTEIEVDAGDATGNTALAAFSGFNVTTPTRPGHVFRTVNGLSGAATWTDLSGDLPDLPVNALAIDPTRTPHILYAGTDIGVFQSLDDGAHWLYLSVGHPVVSVFGLDRNPKTGQIVSSTHGRGMFQLISNGLPDTTSPICGGAMSGNQFNGTALDAGANDTGIATIVLLPGSINLVISSTSFSSPGSATYIVTTIDHFLPGSGTVRVTDFAGNFCDQAISIPAGPLAVGANFFTLTPCRVVDTRTLGPGLAAGTDTTFFLAGSCGIPVDASSIAANVTVTGSTASGDLRVFAGSTSPPLTSVINYRAGQTRANNAVVQLGPGGSITVHVEQGSGTVQFIFDVSGYFQ